ncbi:MAG TPA: hypothetical protein VIF62_15540, partial [Labilithrix sp.]
MQSGIQWCPHCGKPHKLNVLVCPASGRSLQRGVTRPEEVSHPLIGAVIDGRYRVLRVLGKGGLGIVFEAENTAMR